MEGRPPAFFDNPDTSKDGDDHEKDDNRSQGRRPRVPMSALGADGKLRVDIAAVPSQDRMRDASRLHGFLAGGVSRPEMPVVPIQEMLMQNQNVDASTQRQPLAEISGEDDEEDEVRGEGSQRKGGSSGLSEVPEIGDELNHDSDDDQGGREPTLVVTGDSVTGDLRSEGERGELTYELMDDENGGPIDASSEVSSFDDEGDSSAGNQEIEEKDDEKVVKSTSVPHSTTGGGPRTAGFATGSHVVIPTPPIIGSGPGAGSGGPTIPPHGPISSGYPSPLGPGVIPSPGYGPVGPNVVLNTTNSLNVVRPIYERASDRHTHPGILVAAVVLSRLLGRRHVRTVEARFAKEVGVIKAQAAENKAIQAHLAEQVARHDEMLTGLQTNQMEAEQLKTVLEKRVEEIGVTIGSREAADKAPAEASMKIERPSTVVPEQKMTRPGISKQELSPDAPSPEWGADGRYLATRPNVPGGILAEEIQMPRSVMEQAAMTAESNVAVEKVYERRSEVKDDPSSAAGGAQSGSGGGGFLPSYQSSQATARKLAETQAALHTYQQRDEEFDVDYRRAVVNGFVAGVLVIIVGLIAYLVMR